MKQIHHHPNEENYMIQIMKTSAKKNMMMPSGNYKVVVMVKCLVSFIYFISSDIQKQGKEKQGKSTCYCEEFDGKN